MSGAEIARSDQTGIRVRVQGTPRPRIVLIDGRMNPNLCALAFPAEKPNSPVQHLKSVTFCPL